MRIPSISHITSTETEIQSIRVRKCDVCQHIPAVCFLFCEPNNRMPGIFPNVILQNCFVICIRNNQGMKFAFVHSIPFHFMSMSSESLDVVKRHVMRQTILSRMKTVRSKWVTILCNFGYIDHILLCSFLAFAMENPEGDNVENFEGDETLANLHNFPKKKRICASKLSAE